RRPGMRDGLGVEPRASQLPGLARDVVEDEPSRDLGEIDREQRRREVAADPRVEAPYRRGRPPDVELRLRVPDGREEPKTLDVIEMQVREEHVDLADALPYELEPQ